MRIAIIAGTAYPCNPNYYGSESTIGMLANELARLGNEVTLYAAAKSLKGRYKLRLLPCTWGRLSYAVENTIMIYHDEIVENDFVIDASPLCMFCENIYFWEREWLKKHVLVYFRNSPFSANPRPPVSYNLHSVWLSNTAIDSMSPFVLPRELCHVINYGIDLDLYKPGEKKEDYILYLGAPRREKGIFHVLELAKQLPDQKFVFAWKAFSEEHVRNEREWKEAAKGVENVSHVEYESVSEKVKLLQRAKAFIQLTDPSYVEAFGLAICEALACGTPVILRNLPCHKELFSGIAYFVNDVKDAVEIIRRDEWPTPEQCHEFVAKHYPLSRFARQFIELYNELKK